MIKATALAFLLLVNGSAIAANLSGIKCGLKQNHTTCIEGPETRVINGVPVYRDCWNEKTEYVCIQPGKKNTCGPAIARGATLTGALCKREVDIDGALFCILEEREYTSTIVNPGSTTVPNCAPKKYCLDGKCFDTGHTPDPDFAKAVTGMEVTRQAASYMDDGGFKVFRGDERQCSKSVLKNCCAANGGGVDGLTNLAVMGGSAYLYDVLGAPRAIVFAFDPTAFALSMAVLVVQQMLACEEKETLLAVQRDKQLCVYIGDYCSKYVNLLFTKICVQKKETFCCYNSKLARIINVAFRSQTGASWGTPEKPSCGGLTVEQFQTLNFAAIDFSEFYADISPDMSAHAAAPAAGANKVKCYFQNDPSCP